MECFNINNRRYLGSKYKLLDFIDDVIVKESINYDTFFDVFAGTGVVANHFSAKGKKVILNDILKSNYYSYLSWFRDETINNKLIVSIIKDYNNLKSIDDNYFSKNFSDTYFSYENSKRIGFIREDIEQKYSSKLINNRERAILITSLIYALDKIANTVGHYDAYRKSGDLHKKLELKPLNIIQTHQKNLIFNTDSNILAKTIKADIAYIDPPYNSRQYSDAYHLLENIAEWKKLPVHGIARKMDRKHIKSKYCTQQAPSQFKDLISNLDVKYIIVSYNNMGSQGAGRSQAKISDNEIYSILGEKGKVKVFETNFAYYSTGKTNLDDHKERLFLCKVGEKTSVNISLKPTKKMVKSPLNYTGGKYKLLPQLLQQFPTKIDTFIDMFSGAANVGANVDSEKIYCIDNQKELVRLLKLFSIKTENEIIHSINNIIYKYTLSNSSENSYLYYGCNSNNGLGSYNKEHYLKLRTDYNSIKKNSYEKDYLFLALIIFGFNNQIRFNSKGEFNMPVGKRDFNNSIKNNLQNFVRKLHEKNIEFISSDFRNFNIPEYTKGETFVYLDPPYFLGTASYNENKGWTKKDERDLLNHINEINKKNIKFALSNVVEHKGEKHELLVNWALKNKYNINYMIYNYSNSNYQSSSKNHKTLEVLITNYLK